VYDPYYYSCNLASVLIVSATNTNEVQLLLKLQQWWHIRGMQKSIDGSSCLMISIVRGQIAKKKAGGRHCLQTCMGGREVSVLFTS